MASLSMVNECEGLQVSKLSDVYPNIAEELCSKHSLNMTRIKHKFEALYSKYKPSKFIVAKGIAKFVRQNNSSQQTRCLFAVEQGIIIAVAKTQSKSNTFINYNKWEAEASSKEQHDDTQSQFMDELILSTTGSIIQSPLSQSESEGGDHANLSHLFSSLYCMAIEDISLSKLNGIIMYIHSNLASNCFYQKQAMLWAFYVAVLDTTGIIHEYSLADIKARMLSWAKSNMQTQQSMVKLMQYGDFIFQLQHNTIMRNQQLESVEYTKNKLVFCKIPALASFSKIKQTSLVQQLSIYQNQLLGQGLNFHQTLHRMKLYYNEKKEILSSQHFDDKLGKHLDACSGLAICEDGQFLVLQFTNRIVPDVMRSLTSYTKQWQKSNNDLEKNQQQSKDILETRDRKLGQAMKVGKWGRNLSIEQIVFSSAPSIGLNVLDPQNQIWYIQ